MTATRTLAIDIGGTKFTVAAFDGTEMIRRDSRMTNREGGREWLLEQLEPALREWHGELAFNRCGIGFGGPVEWNRQIVVGGKSGLLRMAGCARLFA